MTVQALLAFILYLAVMLGIGIFFSKKATNLNSYYLGNRSMNKWVVAMSAQASDMSGWLLMGLPGAIYVSGFSQAWIGVGLAIGTYVNWKIVARRLRKYTHFCNDSITLPDFFSNRFRDKSGTLRIFSALFILVFFMFYTTSGFVASAKLFSTVFPLSYTAALFIGVAVVVSYTFLGGFMAVCWTDLIQGLMMLFAVLLVPTMITVMNGGFADTVQKINDLNPYLLNLFTDATSHTSISLIGLISCLAWGLGYVGMPHILVRFMSIDDPEKIRHSRRIAMTWVIITLSAAVAIGLIGRLFVAQRGIELADPEKIFMVMLQNMFHPFMAALLMAAILAAIMSTADSQLLVSASAFSSDFYKRLFRKNASDKELMWVSRFAVLLVAVSAGVLAYQGRPDAPVQHGKSFLDVVMSLVSFAWGGFGATFGPLMVLALFWRRVNFPGALSGMIVGAVTTFVWKFYLSGLDYEIFKLYELAPGFVLSFLTIIVVSLCTEPPSKEITDEFDQVEKAHLSQIKL